MRKRCATALFLLLLALPLHASDKPATYEVTLARTSPPQLAVTATLPIDGDALTMDTTRPGNIPETESGGWPALVRDLKVTDEQGRALAVTSAGAKGWRLAQPHRGRVTLDYRVDYTPLAQQGWPAPREAAYAEADSISLVARSVFIATPAVTSSRVRFALPRGWRAVTPFAAEGGSFGVAAPQDLTINLLAFTRTRPERIQAGGFRVHVVAMGHWRAARGEVRRVLQPAMRYFVRLLGVRERADYLVVLLPMREEGGESFRASFALTSEAPPSAANRLAWGTLLAHEIFHHWNGWRLRPAEYASSQWFQEGFTVYAADLAIVAAGLATPDDFRARLSRHAQNYARLATPLAARVDSKGPPLYSGGALAAFTWDVMIRRATHDKRGLSDFLRALWRATGDASRPYTRDDILAALQATAPEEDWDAFFRQYMTGNDRLPLEATARLAGLRVVDVEGAPRFEPAPDAPPEARALWEALTGH